MSSNERRRSARDLHQALLEPRHRDALFAAIERARQQAGPRRIGTPRVLERDFRRLLVLDFLDGAGTAAVVGVIALRLEGVALPTGETDIPMPYVAVARSATHAEFDRACRLHDAFAAELDANPEFVARAERLAAVNLVDPNDRAASLAFEVEVLLRVLHEEPDVAFLTSRGRVVVERPEGHAVLTLGRDAYVAFTCGAALLDLLDAYARRFPWAREELTAVAKNATERFGHARFGEGAWRTLTERAVGPVHELAFAHLERTRSRPSTHP